MAAIICGLVAIFAAAAGPCQAAQSAANPNEPVAESKAVHVQAMNPSLPRSGARTVVRGVITHSASADPETMRVTASLSRDRVTSIEDLERALDLGRPLDTAALPGEPGRITGPVSNDGTLGWRISLGPHALDRWRNGTYVLEVTATDRDGVRSVARLAVPWYDSPVGPDTEDKMSVTWLWPLTGTPARDSEGILVDDQPANEISPGGRLAALVEGASEHPDLVTWVIDPALLQTADWMTRGYRVLGETGEPGPTQPGADAARWLGAVRAATRSGPVAVRPMTYADADVSSLIGAKLGSDITLANTMAGEMTARLLGRPVGPVLAWPAGAAVPGEAVSALHGAGVRQAQFERSALKDLAGDENLARVGGKGGRLTAVVGDTPLGRTVAGLTQVGAVSGVSLRQLLLGQLAIYAHDDRRISTVISPSRSWVAEPSVLRESLAAISGAPWLRPVTLDALVDEPGAQRGALSLSPMTKKAQRRMLPAKDLREIKQKQQLLAQFAEILTEPADITERFSTALIRAESVAWRRQPDLGSLLTDRVAAQLDAATRMVRPLSSGSVTFAAANGQVPVTIANDLDVAVRVGVKIEGNPSVRLIQEEPVTVDVPARQKVSTQVPAHVLGAGELPAEVQLTTPSGDPFGDAAHMTLRTTAYAAAAAYVVAGAFVALALTIVISTIRRRRKLAGLAADHERAPDE